MTDADARFSPCSTWRYSLTRKWNALPLLGFIGLNPSTADETEDDPTIRRCIGFARDWGFGGIVMLNLFAYRSTDPRQLRELAKSTKAAAEEVRLLKTRLWANSTLENKMFVEPTEGFDRTSEETQLLFRARVSNCSILSKENRSRGPITERSSRRLSAHLAIKPMEGRLPETCLLFFRYCAIVSLSHSCNASTSSFGEIDVIQLRHISTHPDHAEADLPSQTMHRPTWSPVLIVSFVTRAISRPPASPHQL